MFSIDWLTWFGYLASIVTAISLLMSKPLKLRWFNLIGSFLFAAYGILIEAYPVGFFNAIIVFIDGYYIIQIYRSKAAFKEILVSENEATLKFFVEEYANDIKLFFPDMQKTLPGKNFYALQMSGTTIIGIVVGNLTADKTLEVNIDYISPNYRDYKPGRYFFMKAPILEHIGVKKITTKADSEIHANYLKKIGFRRDENIYIMDK